MTTKEKWEIGLGCLSLVLLAWFYMSQLEEIGANDGLKHRWAWWREQRRKKEDAERVFATFLARTYYEAQCALEGVDP